MKAVVYRAYGPPEVAVYKEVEKPSIKENEILLKVYATTVNRTDSGFRSAEYFVSRFWSGLLRPKYTILGCEFAGCIEATGKQVSTFQKGDKVFGYNDQRFGGHAEYLVCSEQDIALIPSGLSYSEAAPITEGAHYALSSINAAKVKMGQEVMVYGATGAIGSAAVQILKSKGARVTAVCNTKNVALLQALGADVVMDYEKQDFTLSGLLYDFIFDAVGKSSFADCRPLLKKNGIYISTELGKYGVNIYLALIGLFIKGKRVLFPIPTINKEVLFFLKELVENKRFKPVIDRHYMLEQVVEAYKYVETGQKTGNVVIQVLAE